MYHWCSWWKRQIEKKKNQQEKRKRFQIIFGSLWLGGAALEPLVAPMLPVRWRNSRIGNFVSHSTATDCRIRQLVDSRKRSRPPPGRKSANYGPKPPLYVSWTFFSFSPNEFAKNSPCRNTRALFCRPRWCETGTCNTMSVVSDVSQNAQFRSSWPPVEPGARPPCKCPSSWWRCTRRWTVLHKI